MKQEWNDLKRILNDTAQALNMKQLKVEETDCAMGDENDLENLQLIVDDEFLISYDTLSRTFFLQEIVHIPGTYDSPPDEDYRDITNGIPYEIVRRYSLKRLFNPWMQFCLI